MSYAVEEGLTKGLAKGRAEGLAEGRVEGRAEGVLKVARNLKNLGMDSIAISQATGLPQEDIENSI